MTLYVAALKFGNGCELPKMNTRIHPVIDSSLCCLLRTAHLTLSPYASSRQHLYQEDERALPVKIQSPVSLPVKYVMSLTTFPPPKPHPLYPAVVLRGRFSFGAFIFHAINFAAAIC